MLIPGSLCRCRARSGQVDVDGAALEADIEPGQDDELPCTSPVPKQRPQIPVPPLHAAQVK